MNKRMVAFIVAFLPSSAICQTGTIISNKAATIPTDKKISANDNRRIMYDFAACTVRWSRIRVKQYLETAPGSIESIKLSTKIAEGYCLMNGSITFKDSSYRAAAYDVMYHMDFAEDAPLDFSLVAPINYAQRGEGMTAEDAVSQSMLRQLADCAVRRGPAEARLLILAPIGSPAETIAFNAFVPSVSGCMTNDVTLKFSKFTMRGFVGEALYRLSTAAGLSQKDR